MTPNRTAALVLILLAAIATSAAAARAGKSGLPPLVFPVVGAVSYIDDFGQARPGGPHQGNDLTAAKRSPAVAVEGGTAKYWTTSSAAGCMLYLYGDSGTTYFYIHLNNDLTTGNDNRGKCVAGVAYAPGLKSGARVEAGQPVGFVGDSGDANGIASHLHFEVHPRDGKAVDPFPYLQKAKRLLFSAPSGSTFTLVLTGTVLSTQDGVLTLNVDTLKAWPSHFKATKLNRTLTLTVPVDAEVATGTAPATAAPAVLADAKKRQRVSIWTAPAPATMEALTGLPGAIAAERVLLRAS